MKRHSGSAASVRLAAHADACEWRLRARALLHAGIPPEEVSWCGPGEDNLLLVDDASDVAYASRIPSAVGRVPSGFLALVERVIAHRDPQRFALLYRLLWRLARDEPRLLFLLTDADVQRANAMGQSVRRDAHKMKAFVRFRELVVDEVTTYVAWFEPEHYIVDYVAPFFLRRFTGMRFSLLTPYRSAHWDLVNLAYGPGLARQDAPSADAIEDVWRTYYANIFNPARLNVRAMQAEMPQKYWKNLPEAELIAKLVVAAPARTQVMIDSEPTTARKRIAAPAAKHAPVAHPRGASEPTPLTEIRTLAQGCRRCPLWQPATQTVFGEGPDSAHTMIIGEQPGDKEDLSGKPFVGPAGRLLDRALQELGVDRSGLYVTNTVKHFKFEPRGKIRLHMRANAMEQLACRPWLDAELDRVRPARIVCLGGMAAQAIFGKGFRLMSERGQWRNLDNGVAAFATVHPSWILRLPAAERLEGYRGFVRDLSLLVDEPPWPVV